MKKILLVFAFAISLFTVSAQEYAFGYQTDTLVNATADTFYVGETQSAAGALSIREYGALNITVVSDSLTGSTAATGVIQYCNDASGTNWYTAVTLTALNGAAQQVQINEDAVFTARKARVILTPSGTQTTRVRFYYCFKGAN